MIVPQQSLLSDWFHAVYRVNDKTTKSKIEALTWANDVSDNVVFDFNDRVWANQPWTVEPTETWQQLCVRRAQQLRQQHQKIILWFSGGYDSLTVAWSFVWANLHVDEILIYKKNWFDENVQDYALEKAQWFKQHYWPNLKIRIIELQHSTSEQFYINHGDDWIYSPWFRTDFTKNSRLSTVNANLDLLKELERPGTVMLDGFDKPRLDIFDGKWYNRLTDQGAYWYIDTPIVNFYISSDMPELNIKQTWLLVNFLEKHNITTNQQLHEVQQIDRWNATAKPFTYEQFSSAPGRVVPDFWFAKEFVNKTFFVGGIKNRETQPLVDHYNNDRSAAMSIYKSGLTRIRSLLPDSVSDSFSLKPIMGTPHFIKPVQI
jgi:hypothetical protein